ncbi:MAG: caspase family protein, partial [Vicinamibacterales bacterium]
MRQRQLVSWNRDGSHNSQAGHPGSLRCDSLTYGQYSRSSRLAIRAPRSGTSTTHHRSRGLAILLLGLTFAPGSPAPAQQPQRPPRVVAFVVGIEQYKEARLNSLEYVGEDAYRVWNGLKAISEFDESRSTILVADRVRTGDLPPRTAETLTRDHITTELERFLGRTRSGDTAVLYFGGHGKVAFEGYGVSFLASNFADDGFVNAIFMRRVIEDARARTASKNVPIVVLANMCHAGAPGVYDPDQTPTLREMSDAGERDVPKTSKAVAYIPAAGAETTYETKSLRGSVFVHHLESALQGGAADEYGRVTSGSLIRRLQAEISEIPRIGAFDDSIVVGRTGRQEAMYRRTLGIALLAAAFDDGDNPQLLRLAESQFARAADRWQSTRPANLLSLAEVRFLLGRESDALETLNMAQQEAATNGDAGVTRRIAALRGPGSKPSTAALSVLLLDGYGRVRAGSSTPSDAALWLDMFKRLPQHRQSARIDVPFPAATGPDGFLAQSEKVVNGWRQAGAPDDMLIVVYSGVAALWDTRSTSSSRADDLRPVSGADLWTLARLWEGPV